MKFRGYLQSNFHSNFRDYFGQKFDAKIGSKESKNRQKLLRKYPFRADMHCHSTCSDGTHSPKELIDLAVSQNLQGLSITDHDTCKAYDAELFAYAKERDIQLVTGVEFSSYHQGTGVHILGYDFLPDHPEILAFAESHKERRKLRNLAILKKLEKAGMPISEGELSVFSGAVIGRPHIAQLMIDKGYVASFKEAFNEYIGNDKPCYVSGPIFKVSETIEVIKKASGKAFLAHPIFIRKRRILNELLSMPFDGMECYYAMCTDEQNDRMLRIAEKRNFAISGGSDFHGENKPYLQLGASFITEEPFANLYINSQRIQNHPEK